MKQEDNKLKKSDLLLDAKKVAHYNAQKLAASVMPVLSII